MNKLKQPVRRKAYKYRLYPTRKQEQYLQWALGRLRELYNTALQERRDAYELHTQSITYNQQANQLPEIKKLRPEYKDIYSQVLQDILRRVDKTMQNFFRRVRQGVKLGYPRFKSDNRFDSFTYPQAKPNGGFSLDTDGKHVSLSKIGSLKVKLYRPIEGKIKTCTIKREIDHWFVVFSCEGKATEPLLASNKVVGVDLGVRNFATLSTGETIENPRRCKRAEEQLVRWQQQLACKRNGSHRRAKVKMRLAKLHYKIKNQRKDFLHKQSRKLVNI